MGAALCTIIFCVGAHAIESSVEFHNTVTGETLNLDESLPQGRDTPGVKTFLQTGIDPYIEDRSCLKRGEQIFLTACSGCHGEIGEGKVGPGLNDDYWTYPENQTDVGIFGTVFGGARAQMGPQVQNLTMDEMLLVIAWVRHLYKDDVKHAPWFNEAQKKTYQPYKLGEKFSDEEPGICAAPPRQAAAE
ncbi:cytochrome c(L), periplasmic [Rhodoblastus sphagnicola]|uniref:Cytochrome c-L n=2 Tax=Rhodoblastus sphagnicola TaxID=333368 RepID=A0A2S6NEF0_9HYPH|nr:cytochrome c(L), periplasmic [Rhodoblastus sphagnicola]PPQ32998.1 cytochrome c(L), periplasmic [Rhodoblastus sphagnicola]